MDEDFSSLVVPSRASQHVLLIKFDRPNKRNALHSSMIIALGALLKSAEEDPEIRCVVITGSNEIFAAGADIKEMFEKGPPGTSNNQRRVEAWRYMQSFSKPLIAAVNGPAIGAGSELALLCDFIIAGRNASFAQPEVNLGGMAGDGGTQRLPRKVGSNVASYMLFSGLPIDVEAAHRLGLVVEICAVEETVRRAVEIGETIAKRAPIAVQLTKVCIRVAVGATLENGIAFERDAIWRNSQTADRQEGMRAFVEKRAPKFIGH